MLITSCHDKLMPFRIFGSQHWEFYVWLEFWHLLPFCWIYIYFLLFCYSLSSFSHYLTHFYFVSICLVFILLCKLTFNSRKLRWRRRCGNYRKRKENITNVYIHAHVLTEKTHTHVSPAMKWFIETFDVLNISIYTRRNLEM